MTQSSQEREVVAYALLPLFSAVDVVQVAKVSLSVYVVKGHRSGRNTVCLPPVPLPLSILLLPALL